MIDLQDDFTRAQRTVDEMTPLPTCRQRLGWLICLLSGVAAVTAGYFVVVWPLKMLFELAVGR